MTEAKRRRRVLIVEDEPALRLSYQRAFQPRYDLVFARTGAEAMEQLELQPPDVAVLDMRLPDTDGVELMYRSPVDVYIAALQIVRLVSRVRPRQADGRCSRRTCG